MVVRFPKLEKLALRVMNMPVSACGGNRLIIQAPMKKIQDERMLLTSEVTKIIQGYSGKTIRRYRSMRIITTMQRKTALAFPPTKLVQLE